MKNLLIYVNPSRRFQGENDILIKIQIDNSLRLGWKKEDILLITNFEYEYSGVKAQTVDDKNFCNFDNRVSKISVILEAIDKGIIEDNQLYWFHDLDAFQLVWFPEEEIEMFGADLALTDRGWSNKWSTGSLFFTKKARDLFEKIRDKAYEHKINEEPALQILTDGDEIPKERYKKVNIRYNLSFIRLEKCYQRAIKPLRVVHFHPIEVTHHVHFNRLDIFMYGKNPMGVVLLSDGLIELFNKYGIK